MPQLDDLDALIESLSDVPTDATELDGWLAAHEARIAEAFGRQMRELVTRYLSRALTAALVDPGAFDGFMGDMGLLADDVAEQVGELYLSGGLSAWLRSPAAGVASLAEQQRWARVVNDLVDAYTTAVGNRIRGASEATWQEIRTGVVESTQLGDFTTEELTGFIQEKAGYSEFRANTIARTEVVGGYNGGTMAGARALPDQYQPVEKEWLAALDGRTRDSHAEADGQVVPFGADFNVGGSPMPQPGIGPPEEVVNCRCTVLLYYPGDTRTDGSVVG